MAIKNIDEKTLRKYGEELNALLERDGHAERFSMQCDESGDGRHPRLELVSLYNSEKTIKLILGTEISKDENITHCIIVFLEEVQFTYFTGLFDTVVSSVYKKITAIIKDKIGVITERIPAKKIMRRGIVTIDLDVDGIEYGEEERRMLTDPRFNTEVWSGFPSENIRLFCYGTLIGSKSVREKRLDELFDELKEREDKSKNVLLWSGKTRAAAALRKAVMIPGILCTIWLIISLIALPVDMQIFIFLCVADAVLAVILFPLIFFLTRGWDYIITDKYVCIKNSSNRHLFFYCNIVDVKITYALGEKNKNCGTVRIIPSSKKLFKLSIMESVRDPETVREIILRAKEIAPKQNPNNVFYK